MNRVLIVAMGFNAILCAACGHDARQPGNGSMQTGGQSSGLYVSNGDQTISRLDTASGAVKELSIGREPTRIARIGRRIFVSLRDERAVAILEEDGGTLDIVGRFETGSEPFGLATTDERIFVAASTQGTVDEYHAKTHEHLRSWSIPGEPRWLALHPSRNALFVGSTYGGHLNRIELASGEMREIALPSVSSFNLQNGQPFELAHRITGDLAVTADAVYVPTLYVDNETPIRDVDASNIDDPMTDPCSNGGGGGDRAPIGPETGGSAAPPPDDGRPGPGPGNCGGGYNDRKFNPSVVRMPVEPEDGEIAADEFAEVIPITSNLTLVDERGFAIGGEPISSYPSSVAVTPDGELVLAAMDGSQAVVAFRSRAELGAGGQAGERATIGEAGPGGGRGVIAQGFSFRALVAMRTGVAPRGLAIVGDQLFVHAQFDRRVEAFDLKAIRGEAEFFATGNRDAVRGLIGPDGSPRALRPRTTQLVSTTKIDPAVEAGRRLFLAANNPVMAAVGAGVSCGTCHFDGRTDGLTWHFERGLRQTPNLSVDMQYALPVGWAGNVPSVGQEGFSTSQRLMGGVGLSVSHTQQIEAFLFSLRRIDTPERGSSDPALVRGAALFATKGCLSCHLGPAYTDNRVYPMLGLERVKTRPLTGIAASGPYFHDGSAATLDDVVRRAAAGEMGQPFQLTDAERADLVTYLRSL